MIKKFESYGKYYWEITSEEFSECLKDGVPEKFKQRELDWFVGKLNTDISFLELVYSDFYKSFIKRWTYKLDPKSRIIGLLYRYKSLPVRYPSKNISNTIEIYKYEDEYFTVSVKEKNKQPFNYLMYKCDQWEGLVELIKKIHGE